MNKKLFFSILMLQALWLFGADYTAEKVTQMLDNVQAIKTKLPKDLPAYKKLDATPVACSKCGKKMVYVTDVSLMDILIGKLNEKSGHYLFALDKTRVCPHCGDGRVYLKVTTKNGQPKLWQGKNDLQISCPVNVEDLLFLIVLFSQDKDIIDMGDKTEYCTAHIQLVRPYDGMSETFITITDADYEVLSKKNAEHFKLTPELQKRVEEQKAKNYLIGKNFQKLTENATVLRKKDLDKFLKDLSTLPIQDSRQIMSTRMMILPEDNMLKAYAQLTCPKCNGVFHVLNGSNMPAMAPLGDLKRALEKFDIVPDYSSICPKCHPEKGRHLLKVTFHIGGKEYPSQLSPKDLIILCQFMEGQTYFMSNDIARLRNILQGIADNTHIVAKPAPEK